MNKFKSIYIPIALFLTLCFSFCSKKLDEKVVSGVSANNYFVDASGFVGGVNATYAPLRSFWGKELGANLTEFGTDLYTEGLDGAYKALNQYTNALSPNIDHLNIMWANFYAGINSANTVIGRADGIRDLTDALKKRGLGEVRFLRALYYFMLVQTFGDVPLTTKEISTVQTETVREKDEKIYTEVIIPDLQYAIANLPATQSEYGRVTKPAAQALMARVMLVRKNWAEVEALSRSVINDFNFQLAPTYGEIWRMDNQRNREVIWAVQYTSDAVLNANSVPGSLSSLPATLRYQYGGNQNHLHFQMAYDIQPNMQRDVANGRPFRRYRFTPYGNQLFDNKADRRYVEGLRRVYFVNRPGNNGGSSSAVMGDTAVFLTTDIVPAADRAGKRYRIFDLNDLNSSNSTALSTFLTPVKFVDPLRADVNAAEGSRDYFVFRIAEMHLNLAEALFMQGKIPEATTAINVLRKQRSMPGFDLSITQAQMTMNFLLDERARELFGENIRWFDLKRTGTLVTRVKQYNTQAANNIQDFHLLRPVPQEEINRSTNKVTQNPGY